MDFSVDTGSKMPNVTEMPGLYQRLAWNSPFMNGINSIASGIGLYTKPAMNRAFYLSSWYHRMAKRTGPWPGMVFTDRVFAVNFDRDINETVDEANSGESRIRTRVKGTLKTSFDEVGSGPLINQPERSLKLSVLMPFKPVNTGTGKRMKDLKSELVGSREFVSSEDVAVSGLTMSKNLSQTETVPGVTPCNEYNKKPWNMSMNDIPEAPKVRIPIRVKSWNGNLAGTRELKPMSELVQNVKENTADEKNHHTLFSKINQADELLMFRPSREDVRQRINKVDQDMIHSRKLDMLNELGVVESDFVVPIEKSGFETPRLNHVEAESIIKKEAVNDHNKQDVIYRVKGKSQQTGTYLKKLLDPADVIRDKMLFKPAIMLATRNDKKPDEGEIWSDGFYVVPTLQFLAHGRQFLNNSFSGFEPSVFEGIRQPNRREIPASNYSNQTINVKILGQNTSQNENHQMKNEAQGWREQEIDYKDNSAAGYNTFLPYTETISDQDFDKLIEMTKLFYKGDGFSPNLTEALSYNNDKPQQSNETDKEERATGKNYGASAMESKVDVGLIVEEVYKRVSGKDQTEKERKGLY